MTTLISQFNIEYAGVIVSVARVELGTREENNNSGARVMEYQAASNTAGTHWPWCAAFVAWVLKRAAKKLGIVIPWSNSADCDVLLVDMRNRGLLRDSPQPGDVFLVRAKLDNGNYSKTNMVHTGIVERVNGDGTFTEIAGNTNDDGGREGYEVGRNTHHISARYYFGRPLDAVVIPETSTELAPTATWTACVKRAKGSSGSTTQTISSKLINGHLWVPIREWGQATKKAVDFNKEHQAVTLAGKELGLKRQLIDGQSYFSLEALTLLANGSLRRDSKTLQATAEVP